MKKQNRFTLDVSINDYKRAKRLLEDAMVNYDCTNSDFIHVPSINLLVAKERSWEGESLTGAEKELHARGQRIITLREMREFLKFTKENYFEIYEEITGVREPLRGEYLDARIDGDICRFAIHYYSFNEEGKIIKNRELINQSETLMRDRRERPSRNRWSPEYGISLENWLANPTKNGFPRKDIEKGKMCYEAPSICWFYPSAVKLIADDTYFYLAARNQRDIDSEEYCGFRAVMLPE